MDFFDKNITKAKENELRSSMLWLLWKIRYKGTHFISKYKLAVEACHHFSQFGSTRSIKLTFIGKP